jgi:hypothetical protein
MSNYLQNLIAKSFNQVEVARPRLASLFEPLSPGVPGAFGEIHPAETPDFERPPEDGHSTGTAQDRKDGQLNRALPLPTRKQPPQESETPVWRGNQQPVTFQQQTAEAQSPGHQTTPQQRMNFQPPAPQEIEKAPEESHSSKRRFLNFTEPGRQPTRQRKGETGLKDSLLPDHARTEKDEKHSWQQSHSKSHVPTRMQNAREQIRRPINNQPAKQERKASSPADLPLAAEANKIGLQPRIALRVESQKASGNLTPGPHLPLAQQSEIQAAPTINVTIGRIEVRATTPATQPRRQPPGAQTMSLDEYLRRRNQGGAR